MIKQYFLKLPAFPRGFHLITNLILEHIPELPEAGLMNIFVKHTSAGITLNENADPSVRVDFESSFNKLIKENESHYTHVFEGSDDMPAHIKSTIAGSSVTIPISNFQLNLGAWQGVYFCEFRNHGGSRRLLISVYS